MAILIDKQIQKFVEGCFYEEDGKVISIHLKDIDETFWFDSEVDVQNFLNKQAIERVGAPVCSSRKSGQKLPTKKRIKPT